MASVCILPYYLKRCAELLRGSDVRASTTIGFPHGGHTTAVKVAEARQALDDGGEELDMVVNTQQVLSGDWDYVRREIAAVIELTHGRGGKVKVIFENCYLRTSQKIRLCEICGELRADWVKTITGYGTGGATLDDLPLMREHSPAHVQVKAAGGVRDLDMALAVREVGRHALRLHPHRGHPHRSPPPAGVIALGWNSKSWAIKAIVHEFGHASIWNTGRRTAWTSMLPGSTE